MKLTDRMTALVEEAKLTKDEERFLLAAKRGLFTGSAVSRHRVAGSWSGGDDYKAVISLSKKGVIDIVSKTDDRIVFKLKE
jgi:hypothetical protein